MPTKISDVIEQFLLETIGDSDSIFISRNELAHYFSVAPSQINYVLSTRFTLERGYDIESKRGGGGYITIKRLNEEGYLMNLVKSGIGDKIEYAKFSIV